MCLRLKASPPYEASLKHVPSLPLAAQHREVGAEGAQCAAADRAARKVGAAAPASLVLPHDLLEQLCMPHTASGRPAATMRHALGCLYTTRYSNAMNCRDTKRREAIDLEASCNSENSTASNGGAQAASAAQAGANRSNGGAAPPPQQQQQHQQQVGNIGQKTEGRPGCSATAASLGSQLHRE